MKNANKLDESTFAEDLKSGNKHVFEYIFNKYYKALCLCAQKYVRDRHVAEEVVSTVFMRIWERRESINITGSLSSYLYKAVCNESLNYLSSFSYRHKPTDSIYIYLEDSYSEPGILQELYTEELQKKISRGIESLPERCQYIFYLSRNQGLSHKEISEKLNITVSTVENQIGIALHKLRDFFKTDR
ncbi:MAG: RNA polymerase sigma-70 factor [Bacteroidales bacterium]|nr:RNA polymerase sigma-70 factor [Bacteroidales bacterium]MBN2699098.1 RNA polymerase sigma-70 factor [Bacteroidales bacterium]